METENLDYQQKKQTCWSRSWTIGIADDGRDAGTSDDGRPSSFPTSLGASQACRLAALLYLACALQYIIDPVTRSFSAPVLGWCPPVHEFAGDIAASLFLYDFGVPHHLERCWREAFQQGSGMLNHSLSAKLCCYHREHFRHRSPGPCQGVKSRTYPLRDRPHLCCSCRSRLFSSLPLPEDLRDRRRAFCPHSLMDHLTVRKAYSVHL